MVQMNLFTKENGTNELIYKIYFYHRGRKETSGYQWGKEGRGINRQIGIDIYALL